MGGFGVVGGGSWRSRGVCLLAGCLVASVLSLVVVEGPVGATGSYSDGVLALDPFVYWEFEESSWADTTQCTNDPLKQVWDTAADENGGYQCSFVDGSSVVPASGGRVGQRAAMSGGTSVGASAYLAYAGWDTSGESTIEAFVRTSMSPSVDTPVLSSAGFSVGIRPSGEAFLKVRTLRSGGDRYDEVDSGFDLADGAWHHVVLIADDALAQVRLVIDRVPVAAVTNMVGPPHRSPGYGHPSISVGGGATTNPTTSGFVGDIDEFAAYNRVLTSLEIGDHMTDAGMTPPPWDPNQDSPFALSELFGPNPSLRNQVLCQACDGDPVDARSGNLFMPVPAVAVAGRGPGLAVELGYNSLRASEDSSTGFGWSSTLDMRVEVNGAGDAAVVVQETGATVPFVKDENGDWTAPERHSATLVESGGGFTFTRNHFDSFTFDTQGRLSAIADQFDNVTEVHYPNSTTDEADHLKEAGAYLNGTGRELGLSWSGGRLSAIEDPMVSGEGGPRTASFSYDGSGNLTSYTDLSGGTWVFTYDDAEVDPGDHLMTKMRKPRHGDNNLVIENNYDDRDRVEWQEDELNRRTNWDYDTPGPGETKVTLPGGRIRVHGFVDGRRQVTTDGWGTDDAVTTTVELDPETFAIERIIDNGENATVFTDSNDDGNVDYIEDPTHRFTQYTYNGFDQVTHVRAGASSGTETDGVLTVNQYDSLGRLTNTTVAVGTADEADTIYSYDPNHSDDLVKITDDRSEDWTFTYNGATGYRETATNPELETTEWTYNSIGWPTTMTSPRGVATTSPTDDFQTVYGYDIANRTTTVTDPEGVVTETVLDANGNVETVATGPATDLTDITEYTYTAADELDRVTYKDGATVLGVKRYSYRTDGLLDWYANELTNPLDPNDLTWDYGYDDAGRLTDETDALDNTTTYEYDDAGNLKTIQQPVAGATCETPKVGCITYDYDAAGRPTSVDYSDPNTPDVTNIDYDALGRRDEATVGGVTEAWGWNNRSQLTSHTDVHGDTTSYLWDGTGNLTKITYPDGGSGLEVIRHFDGAGRLEWVKDWNNRTITFDYDDDGNWATTVFPGSSGTANTDSYLYDEAGRMETATWYDGDTNGTVLGSEAYTRPASDKGMVDVITPTGSAGSSAIDHEYDDRDRLTAAGSDLFGYDAATNLVTQPDGTLQVFDPAQRLCWTSPLETSGTCPPNLDDAPDGATTYSYDPLGNRDVVVDEDNGVRDHDYDQANRLTQVTDSTASGDAPISTLNGAEPLVEDYDGDGESDIHFYKSGPADDWVWWGTDRDQFGSPAEKRNVTSDYEPFTGDFNCDGFGDTFWYRPGTGLDFVWFWFGRYDGDHDQVYLEINTSDYTPFTGDFDGDTCSDVYWYRAGSGSDWIWWGKDNVDVQDQEWTSTYSPVSGTFSPVTGDFNGDGRDDLFWYRPGSGSDPIWWGQASRSAFGSGNQTTENVNGTYDVTTGDIDDDDNDDLVFEHDTSSTDFVWWGTTPANFGNSQNTYTFPASVTVHAGDYDGDGHSDVFFYDDNGTNDTIWWGDTRNDFGTDVGIDTISQTTNTYTYDTDGLRSSKTVNGATAQDFTWDTSSGLPLLLAETQGSTITRIVYGPGGQPIAEITDNGTTETTTWLHHDQLGSVRLSTDATNGSEVSSRGFTPYGEVADQSGDQPLLGYAGQYTDHETGYQYLRARYYDPTTGQFLTRDPIVATTEEPYGYVSGSPVNGTDPSGLCGPFGDAPCTPTGLIEEVTGFEVDCVAGKNADGSCRGADEIREHVPGAAMVTGLVAAGCLIGGALTSETAVGAPAGATCAAVAGTASNILGAVLVATECGTDPSSDACERERNFLLLGLATSGLSNGVARGGAPLLAGMIEWSEICFEWAVERLN